MEFEMTQTQDAHYILDVAMDDMKGTHRFVDIFWTDQLVDDIRLHRFTPSRHFQKETLWKGLCMTLCGVIYVSDQAGILDDEEDQRKSQGTMIYMTYKSIRSGKAIPPPL